MNCFRMKGEMQQYGAEQDIGRENDNEYFNNTSKQAYIKVFKEKQIGSCHHRTVDDKISESEDQESQVFCREDIMTVELKSEEGFERMSFFFARYEFRCDKSCA